MKTIRFTEEQQSIISASSSARIFLSGPSGSGKSTVGVERVRFLISSGIEASSILVLVPQRTLATPYYAAIKELDFPSGGVPEIVTLGGLGQRLTSLFWPILAKQAGFSKPSQPPTFLTLETAQYFMARLVQPMLDEGYFESLTIDRNRLYSQILDNLNKSAVVGFPIAEICARLSKAWIGEPTQTRIYSDAQECAVRFRNFCLAHNLLDFSLQFDVFNKFLWNSFICREFMFSQFQHIIFDNVEEDVPVVHDVIRAWMPHFSSALLIYDTNSGYRSFLGADPDSGLSLQNCCDQGVVLNHCWITSPELLFFNQCLSQSILHQTLPANTMRFDKVIEFANYQFAPQMVDGVVQKVNSLITVDKVPPGEIAILSPFLSDSLRFSLQHRLENLGIKSYSHRPSRSLADEPATHCLLTLAKLAHPNWKLPIMRLDFRSALMQVINKLDLVRADLLSLIVFHQSKNSYELGSFDAIRPEMQERLTYSVGERYEKLLTWIKHYQANPPEELDIFLSRIFGELLSQPGFAFHTNYDSANQAARLIESIQKFRRVTGNIPSLTQNPFGYEYIQLVDQGVIAAQYMQNWLEIPYDSVFIAPAYTFLMANRPVNYQFWLDIGSHGWWERLYQPLTHPVVLSRHWMPDQVWNDANEYNYNQNQLSCLTSGLIQRCKSGIFFCYLGINEQGHEQRGLLLTALQTIRRKLTGFEPPIV